MVDVPTLLYSVMHRSTPVLPVGSKSTLKFSAARAAVRRRPPAGAASGSGKHPTDAAAHDRVEHSARDRYPPGGRGRVARRRGLADPAKLSTAAASLSGSKLKSASQLAGPSTATAATRAKSYAAGWSAGCSASSPACVERRC